KRVFLVILFTSFSGSLVSRISGAVHIAFKHAYRQQYQYYFADKQMSARGSYEYRCTTMG
ncbi:hypothetical protein PO329_24020, partial [Escherichia coli]